MNGKDYEDILKLVDVVPSSKMYEIMQMVSLKTINEMMDKTDAEDIGINQAKAKQFIEAYNAIAEKCNAIARSKGFYKTGVRNDGQSIALMHSELSEALEYMRNGNPKSDHIPEYSGVEEELADCILRIMNYAYNMGYHVGEALIEKMKFNCTRQHIHTGKMF